MRDSLAHELAASKRTQHELAASERSQHELAASKRRQHELAASDSSRRLGGLPRARQLVALWRGARIGR